MPIRPLPATVLFLLLCGSAEAVDRLDPRDFDTATAACTDFYQYANGAWLRATPVPAGQPRVNRLTELQAANRLQREDLLRALGHSGSDPLDAPLAAFAASVLDEAALAPARQAAFAALLPALDDLRKPAHAVELLSQLQARGLDLFFNVANDAGTLRLQGTALTLGDPAFYLDPSPAARELLGRYRGYVQTLLGQAGSSDVATDSAWVLDFESRLARALATAVAPGDNGAAFSLRELGRQQPALQWKALLKASALAGAARYRQDDSRLFAELDRMVNNAPPVAWRAWLRFRIAHLLAPYADSVLADAQRRFFVHGLAGDESTPERRELALQLTEQWLGEAFSQRYVDTHFGADRRADAEALVAGIRASLHAAIERNDRWQAATRERALAKLDALRVEFSLPAARVDLSKLQLSADNLIGNVLALARWLRQQAVQGGAQVDALRPQLEYLREHNRLVLSPALFQPPMYSSQADSALKYGGLGALIAHELLQGFDLGGSSFDATGAAQPWWDEADRAAWIAAAEPLIAHYGKYSAIGKRLVDGQRSQHENMADLGGLTLAWQAFIDAGNDPLLPLQDGHSPAQRVFLAWASLWRENALEATSLADAEHAASAPAKVRVNAPLALLPAFASSFRCTPAQPMLAGALPAIRPWP